GKGGVKEEEKETETVLHSFGSGGDGWFPIGDLVKDGTNYYGVTFSGGSDGGGGTVFKVDSSGRESVLHSFYAPPFDSNSPSPDGDFPQGGVILSANDNLYGSTSVGGTSKRCSLYGSDYSGCGTVFKLTTDGTETVLYRFCSQPGCTDGAVPIGSLFMDTSGNLYGVTNGPRSPYGSGAIFELSPKDGDWVEQILYNFRPGDNGYNPAAGVVMYNGSLFGTARLGGIYDAGVIYKLSPNPPDGWTYKVIHRFAQLDGANPTELLMDSTGNLYGTTASGGIPGGCPISNQFPSGCGVVFEYSTGGEFSVVYRFAGGTDGSAPLAKLLIDSSGNLYGTTYSGGGTGCGVGCGTVFELSPQGGGHWTESILYNFNVENGVNGASPKSALVPY
ncbi:MAG: choice-of-anchor tandem repeat GloVer-containing protein, partial [Mycobacterium sp.]